MSTTIRSQKGHDLTMAKLREGYREQRAWLSVGMEKHTVQLVHDGAWPRPLTVEYIIRSGDGRLVKQYAKRFTKGDLKKARALFRVAGKVGHWPEVNADA